MSKQHFSKQAIILSLAFTQLGPTAVAVDDAPANRSQPTKDLDGLVADDTLSSLTAEQHLQAGFLREPVFGTECFDGAVDSSGIPLLPDLSIDLDTLGSEEPFVGEDIFIAANILNDGRDCAPESMINMSIPGAVEFVAPQAQCEVVLTNVLECQFGDINENSTASSILQFRAIAPEFNALFSATVMTSVSEETTANNLDSLLFNINPGGINFNNSLLLVESDNAQADGFDLNTVTASVVALNGAAVNGAVVNFSIESGTAILTSGTCTTSGGICSVNLVSTSAGSSLVSARIGQTELTDSPVEVNFTAAPPRLVDFNSGLIEVLEDQGIVEVPVFRSGTSEGAVVFTATSAELTATSGLDFLLPSNQQLSWDNGDGEAKVLLLATIDDNEIELPETFRLELIPVSGMAQPGPNASTTVRIYDDETSFFANSFED